MVRHAGEPELNPIDPISLRFPMPAGGRSFRAQIDDLWPARSRVWT